MNLQEAYRCLDLSEDATDEEIEKQYMRWIRKQKADPSISLDDKTEAYTRIRNHRDYGPINENDTMKDKASHFFYYYKIHTVAAVILVGVLIMVGSTIYSNYQERQELAALPDANVEIMFYGSFLHPGLDEEAEEVVEETILALMPDWSRVDATLTYHSTDTENLLDVGAQQRSTVLLATERPDLYIFDEASFQTFVGSGMFEPLDEINDQVNEEVFASSHVYGVEEGESEEQLVGLKLDHHSLFDTIDINDDVTQIAAIRKDAVNKENALQLILTLQ
ncbi:MULTISPECIES: hypothetical protein [Shouchella]|uniref:J domain-containing protein n=2 Tax=Shouchella TaxID=2893057 RepID=A0ABY7WGK0_9BACI|nr:MULTISPECIES: hypothetical protein [Shouchella]MED4128743.1 hypothetical protein [Shouchella miscanthi]WDF05775.1 hypothetical protein PQ477_10170 [Shouchella hunanensis]GAF20482.1 hypothetical protein JCM19047_122 [Bacillus sp. JCM 19047]